MGNIRTYRIKATIAAGATSATAYSNSFHGAKILNVGINYPGNNATIQLTAPDAIPIQTILTLGAATADATYYPRVALCGNDGVALDLSDTEGGDTAVYGHYLINGRLLLTVSVGTAADSVSIYVTVEE